MYVDIWDIVVHYSLFFLHYFTFPLVMFVYFILLFIGNLPKFDSVK